MLTVFQPSKKDIRTTSTKCSSGVFITNFEQKQHIIPAFSLVTLKMSLPPVSKQDRLKVNLKIPTQHA